MADIMNSKLNLDDILRKLDNLFRKVETFYKQFIFLVDRVAKIENYLSTLTERVQDGSVIVNGNLRTEQITPLNISESELVQVYNDVPKVLLKNSIVAELTAKSYREDRQNEPIFLQNDENGKYWIIVSDKNNIFLVPSINIKLHIHKLKTVEKLFDFRGDTSSVDTHFILTKPAKVSGLPNGKEWKIEEKGILEFSEQVKPELPDFQEPKEHSHVQIQEINQQLDALRLEVNRSHELRKSLESYIVEISKELDDLKLQLSNSQEKQKELESRLEKIPVLRDYAYQQDLQIDRLKVRIESLEKR
jgi:ABC-type phosphate transport system auxiliary subunit